MNSNTLNILNSNQDSPDNNITTFTIPSDGLGGGEIELVRPGFVPSFQDCVSRAIATMFVRPNHRAWIGTVLLHGVHDLRTGERDRLIKPWDHHVWLVGPDGAVLDPGRGTLAEWAPQADIVLPCSPEGMRIEVIHDEPGQKAVVGHYGRRSPSPNDRAEISYLPGVVFSSPVDEFPAPAPYIHTWGTLAAECRVAGGWSAQQLEAELDRMSELMKEVPKLKHYSPVHIPGGGFGTPAQPNRRARRAAARAQRRGRS
jgi:hypothetical protein